eukprot:3543992-Ditylum_brightwellii.AAC.1
MTGRKIVCSCHVVPLLQHVLALWVGPKCANIRAWHLSAKLDAKGGPRVVQCSKQSSAGGIVGL